MGPWVFFPVMTVFVPLFLLKMYLLQNNPLKPQMVKEFGVEKELTKKDF